MWWLLLPVFLYLALCAALYFGQTAMTFPTGQVGPPDPLPARAGRLELATASGETLRGVHIPPDRAGPGGLLILGFAGNAWNAQSAAVFLAGLFPEADVVAFHYRGYPPSEGRPGADALRADALRIHDFARARLRPERVVAIGFSIGGGVAAALAAERTLDGLIVVTPFDSLARVAAGHYPWLPVGLLFRHRLEPARDLAGRQVKLAIIAGGRDTLIPSARTDALRRAAPAPVFDRTIPEAGHNDIYRHPDFAPAIRDAMRRLGR